MGPIPNPISNLPLPEVMDCAEDVIENNEHAHANARVHVRCTNVLIELVYGFNRIWITELK